uniref:CSON010891 protein n=1 Tax=Culicoides sonorensis TaxID=179676 RepID=A0A336M5B3_CULSO
MRKISILHCDDDIFRAARDLSIELTSISLWNVDESENAISLMLNEDNLMLFLDMECNKTVEILNFASDMWLFNKKIKWILHGNDFNVTMSQLKELNINIDARILLVTPDSSGLNVNHFRAPALPRNGLFFIENVGNLTSSGKFKYENPFVVFDSNLHGTILRVAICVPKIPRGTTFIEYATQLIIDNHFSISRSAYQLVKIYSEIFNFQIHLIRVSEYGMLRPNSAQWNGLVGMIQNRFVDFGAQSFILAKTRVPVMDSGFSVIKYRQFFVFCHPEHTTMQKSAFLMPLSSEVWLSILLIAISTVIVLVILQIFEKQLSLKENQIFIFINVVGILAQQGLSFDAFKSIKSRIIIIFFLFMSLISFQFYSASIVGSLLTPAPRTITTIKSLYESNMKIIMDDHPSSKIIFKLVTDPDLVKLYETRIKGKEVFVPVREGIDQMKNERKALLTYVDENADLFKKSLTHAQLERLQTIPIFPQDHRALLVMPLVKGAPFNELIRQGNLRLTENGMKKFILDKFNAKLAEKSVKSFDPAVVDFARTAQIFYTLMIGIVLSFIVLVLEIILKRVRK